MRKSTGLLVLAGLLAGVMPVAGEGNRGRSNDLVRLAHKFEDRAYQVLDEAARDRRFFAGGRDGGFEAFQELTYVATYFSDQVRYERDPYRVAEDFDILAEAFFNAAWWLNRVPTSRHVHKDFRNLEQAFHQLDRHFGYDPYSRGVAKRNRMPRDRYRQVYRTRVIPRVHGRIQFRRGRTRVDVGLRFPQGRVRVVWR
jgi:hypothetical protein